MAKTSNKTLYSGIFWAFGERFASQAISIIVSIVLARFLLPSQFGAIAIVTVIIAILNVFVTGGFGNALIQKIDADQLDYSTALVFSFIFSCLLFTLAYLSAKPIADFYEMPELVPVVRLMAIRLPVASINSIQQAYVAREMRFKLLFFVTLIGVVLSGAIGIIMAMTGFGIYALVAQYLLSMVSDTILIAIITKKTVPLKFSWERFKVLFPFGFSVMLSELVGSLVDNIRTIFIGKRYSAEQLAFYSKGHQFACVIVANVNTALGKVLFPALSKEQEDDSVVDNITDTVLQLSLFILVPLLILLTFCAPSLVDILYNDNWDSMVPYIQVLALSYILVPIQTTSLQRIKAMGYGRAYLVIQVIKISIVLSLIFYVLYTYDSAIYVAYSYLVASFISTGVHLIANKQLFNTGYRLQIRRLWKIFFASGITAVALFLFNLIKLPSLLNLFLNGVICCVFYLGTAYLIKLPVLGQFSIIIKKVKEHFNL